MARHGLQFTANCLGLGNRPSCLEMKHLAFNTASFVRAEEESGSDVGSRALAPRERNTGPGMKPRRGQRK